MPFSEHVNSMAIIYRSYQIMLIMSIDRLQLSQVINQRSGQPEGPTFNYFAFLRIQQQLCVVLHIKEI